MKLLMLGGTEFVGRAIVEAALERGWEVTVWLRKGTPADLIAKAPELETPLDLPQDGLLCQPRRKKRAQVVLRLVEGDPFERMPALPSRKPNSLRMRDKALLAMRMDGDRGVVSDCRIIGWQDTLMVNNGRDYFRDCTIAGRVTQIEPLTASSVVSITTGPEVVPLLTNVPRGCRLLSTAPDPVMRPHPSGPSSSSGASSRTLTALLAAVSACVANDDCPKKLP